jgi:hypothetical protein
MNHTSSFFTFFFFGAGAAAFFFGLGDFFSRAGLGASFAEPAGTTGFKVKRNNENDL